MQVFTMDIKQYLVQKQDRAPADYSITRGEEL